MKHVDVAPGAAREAKLRLGVRAWFVGDLLMLMAAFAAGRAPLPGNVVEDVTGSASAVRPVRA